VNKLIIGCDADGVLTDLSAHNLREGKKTFRREAINPNEYELDKMFDVSDIPKPLLYMKAFGIYRRYCKYERPRRFAPEVLSQLRAKGIEFHLITARKYAADRGILGKTARRYFNNWLKKYSISFNATHFCDEKKSPRDKLLACRKLGVDAMIEDRADNALYLAENGVKVILMDAPYNKELSHKNIIRIRNWNEVPEVISGVEPIDISGFHILYHEETDKLSRDEKNNYFRKYQRYLQSSEFDTEKFRKGDKRFRMLYRIMKLPAKAFFSVKTSGIENLPYQDGFIIACNHSDSSDQYRLGLALGNRPFVGYAAKEIQHTFRGRLFDSTGLGVFIDRNDHDDKKSAAEKMAVYVAHNRTALIFPEGTRKNKTAEGKALFQNRFKNGTAVLAQKTGAGIVPVAVNSFGRKCRISFGEPIYVSPFEEIEEKTIELEKAVAKLSFENIGLLLNSKKDRKLLENEKIKYGGYLKEINSKGKEL